MQYEYDQYNINGAQLEIRAGGRVWSFLPTTALSWGLQDGICQGTARFAEYSSDVADAVGATRRKLYGYAADYLKSHDEMTAAFYMPPLRYGGGNPHFLTGETKVVFDQPVFTDVEVYAYDRMICRFYAQTFTLIYGQDTPIVDDTSPIDGGGIEGAAPHEKSPVVYGSPHPSPWDFPVLALDGGHDKPSAKFIEMLAAAKSGEATTYIIGPDLFKGTLAGKLVTKIDFDDQFLIHPADLQMLKDEAVKDLHPYKISPSGQIGNVVLDANVKPGTIVKKSKW